MNDADRLLPSAGFRGFKHFYVRREPIDPGFSVRGVGVRERMGAGRIERPTGSGDFLFMLFHDPVEIGGASGERRLYPAQTLVLWAPGDPQLYGHPSAGYTHSWIHCEGKRLAQMLADLPGPVPLREPFPIPPGAGLPQRLLEIHRELTASWQPDAVQIGNLLENALRHIARLRSGGAPATAQGGAPPCLLAVREHLGNHSAEPLTLGQMAQMAGMSVPHFSARFKAAFGISPMACLIRHRMLHAAHLLTDRHATIAETARQVGYDDPFHFSRMFRRHFGESPRTFAQREAGEERKREKRPCQTKHLLPN